MTNLTAFATKIAIKLGVPGIGVPPGGTTGQLLAKATNGNFNTLWVDAPEGGGSGAWDEITGKPETFPPGGAAGGVLAGTYPNPTFAADIATQAELDAYAATVTAALANKSAVGHTHIISEIAGLVAALLAKADLVGGLIPTSQIPAIAITEFLGTAANEAAMLAFNGQRGDWCNRSDTHKAYVLIAEPSSTLGNWVGIDYPAAPVLSVNGQAGTVVLGASDIGLGNVNNTSDANKPVSTATQTALNLKSNIASPAFTGTPTAPTATAGTSNTQLATTAFVANAVATAAPGASSPYKAFVSLSGSDVTGVLGNPNKPFASGTAAMQAALGGGGGFGPVIEFGVGNFEIASVGVAIENLQIIGQGASGQDQSSVTSVTIRTRDDTPANNSNGSNGSTVKVHASNLHLNVYAGGQDVWVDDGNTYTPGGGGPVFVSGNGSIGEISTAAGNGDNTSPYGSTDGNSGNDIRVMGNFYCVGASFYPNVGTANQFGGGGSGGTNFGISGTLFFDSCDLRNVFSFGTHANLHIGRSLFSSGSMPSFQDWGGNANAFSGGF